MIDFFISYSRVDSEFADKLYTALNGRGKTAWMDRRGLEGGDDFPLVISQKIAECQCTVVLLSPDADQSEWVRKEVGYASSQKKHIIPLNVRNHQLHPPLDFLLNGINYIDFTSQPFERAVDNLILAYERGKLQKPQPNMPPIQIEKDKLYQAGLSARSKGDLESALLYWNQILAVEPGDQGGTLATRAKEIEDQVRPQRISRIKASAQAAFQTQQWAELLSLLNGLYALDARGTADFAPPLLKASADSCYRAGQWADEIALWQQVQRWQADSPHAAERLQTAKTNADLTPRYTAARQFLAQGNRDLARQELTALWGAAPYYGDPAGLAKTLGLTVPTGIIDALIKRDNDDAQRQRDKAAKDLAHAQRMEDRHALYLDTLKAEIMTVSGTYIRSSKVFLFTSIIVIIGSFVLAGLNEASVIPILPPTTFSASLFIQIGGAIGFVLYLTQIAYLNLGRYLQDGLEKRNLTALGCIALVVFLSLSPIAFIFITFIFVIYVNPAYNKKRLAIRQALEQRVKFRDDQKKVGD